MVEVLGEIVMPSQPRASQNLVSFMQMGNLKYLVMTLCRRVPESIGPACEFGCGFSFRISVPERNPGVLFIMHCFTLIVSSWNLYTI